MYGKKQRIISFLMAFLLIFTFAFINPLTVQKSDAFAFVPVLTSNMARIIIGTLASAGIGITAGNALQEIDYSAAAESIANLVYKTLDGAEKLLLAGLSIVDNIVDVPVELYNKIVNKGKEILAPNEFSATLEEQGISTRYTILTSNANGYSNVTVPLYYFNTEPTTGYFNSANRQLDLSEAVPFLVLEGNSGKPVRESVIYNVFSQSEDIPLYEMSENYFYSLTPDLSSFYSQWFTFGIRYSNNKYGLFSRYNSTTYVLGSDIPFKEDYIIKIFAYTIGGSYCGFIYEYYDKFTNEFVGQYINEIPSKNFGMDSAINVGKDNISPTNYDTTISVESSPAAVVPNTDLTANVLTLPTELSDGIGLTSTEVNVGSTDVPDTPNTETIDNINTNVGELVTGGELGDQINTNIGSVEGLQGEINSQVDFDSIFGIISQYISSLDISSVTWFPTAVASFLVPFLPYISLGLILFFIDRVLNGGA